MNPLWETLWQMSEPGQLLRDEPMSRAHHVPRGRAGGHGMFFPAMRSGRFLWPRWMLAPATGHVPALVVGNGSNLLVRDGGVRSGW